MLVSLVNPIISMVNMGIASGINGGMAVSAIEYSYSLFLTISAIFSYTIGNFIFPTLSKLNIKNKFGEFKSLVNKALDLVMLYSIPVSVILMFCAKLIIKILYERGEFTSYSTELTSGVLIIYGLAILSFSINTIMNKCYYSMSKTKIPFITGIISIMVNLFLGVILSKFIGVKGVAFAYVISSFVNSLLLILLLNKNINVINKYIVKQLFKNVVSGIGMYIILSLLNNMLNGTGIIASISVLVLNGVVGLGIFILINLILKNSLVINVVDIIKNKFKKCT